jgi:hypothetical protein
VWWGVNGRKGEGKVGREGGKNIVRRKEPPISVISLSMIFSYSQPQNTL